MEEKQICCCGSSGWTRLIAWMQIIGSVYASSSYTFAVIGEIAELSVDVKNNATQADGTPIKHEEIQGYKTVGISSLVQSILMLVYAVLNFVMGFVLLCGSINRNPRQIHYWVVYTVLCIAVWEVKTILEFFMHSGFYSAGEFVPILIAITLVLAIVGFFLWVVITHKKEILASAGPVFPVNKVKSSREEEPSF